MTTGTFNRKALTNGGLGTAGKHQDWELLVAEKVGAVLKAI
jgi:hypothetical protein